MNASSGVWVVIPASRWGALGLDLLLEDADIMAEAFEDDAMHQVRVGTPDQ